MTQRRFTGTVTDEQGLQAQMEIIFTYNEAPVIDGIDVLPRPDGTVELHIRARDPEGGPLVYSGSVDAGSLVQDSADPSRFIWSP